MALNLTLLELPNLLALLDWLAELLKQDSSSAEMVSDTAGSIEQLLANLNRPSALAKAVQLREESAALIPEWGRTRFENERLLIERLLVRGSSSPPMKKRRHCWKKQRRSDAYQGADYDLAMAHICLVGYWNGGQAAPALDLFIEAQRLFEALGRRCERMAGS